MPRPSKDRLLDHALALIRAKGYHATSVDDICAAAGLTKGSFFHHFASKDALALEAIAKFGREALPAAQGTPDPPDPLDALLAQLAAIRGSFQGSLTDASCPIGTLVQEAYATHPALREACDNAMRARAAGLVQAIASAKARYAPHAPFVPEEVALFIQAGTQGAIVLAKVTGDLGTARRVMEHVERYVESLFPGA